MVLYMPFILYPSSISPFWRLAYYSARPYQYRIHTNLFYFPYYIQNFPVALLFYCMLLIAYLSPLH